MGKILKIFMFLLIMSIILLLGILSTNGIQTGKFNNLISQRINDQEEEQLNSKSNQNTGPNKGSHNANTLLAGGCERSGTPAPGGVNKVSQGARWSAWAVHQ